MEYNLKYYNLEQFVTLKKLNFNDWLDQGEEFDLLHLDISNTAETIQTIYKKYPNSKIIFEGGTLERDNVEWMLKYNKSKILEIQSDINYSIINNNFPGLSGIHI